MYQKLPNLILGFHGCSRDVFERVVFQGESLKASENDYDWLGHGIYFWEQNYQRAWEWANVRYGSNGAVIGSVLDLGYCLNLTDSASTDKLKQGYALLKVLCETAGTEMPHNRKSTKTKDILLRDLDCAVIQQLHDFNSQMGRVAYDSVRGIFLEGDPPYPGSEFRAKTHVQLCIRNPNCIKGYFMPLEANTDFVIP